MKCLLWHDKPHIWCHSWVFKGRSIVLYLFVLVSTVLSVAKIKSTFANFPPSNYKMDSGRKQMLCKWYTGCYWLSHSRHSSVILPSEVRGSAVYREKRGGRGGTFILQAKGRRSRPPVWMVSHGKTKHEYRQAYKCRYLLYVISVGLLTLYRRSADCFI
jgi:hypothetical protein